MTEPAAYSTLPRNVWIGASLVLFLLVLFVGTGGFLAARGLDAGAVSQIAATMAVRGMEGGYKTVAFIYGHTSQPIRTGITLVFGSSFIVACMWPLRNNLLLALVFVMLVAPITLSLTQFTKDQLLIPFVLASLAILRSRAPHALKVLGVVVLYAIYAELFRSYYLAISAVFVALYFSRFLPPWGRVFLAALLVVGLAAAPTDLFFKLEGGRDFVNIRRIGHDVVGAKTAFMNLRAPTNYGNFLLNYGYAAIRLNLPVLFSLRLQELYLFVNVAAYASLAFIGLRLRTARGGRLFSAAGVELTWAAQVGALLFLAHVLLLLCFEPDLGSYLRHMSSALPYLIPTLVACDRALTQQFAQSAHDHAQLGPVREFAR